MEKETFKKFVSLHPNLASYVINNKMTWQQFYELFDLYGENNSIWDNFKDGFNINNSNNSFLSNFKELINLFKGIDLPSIQKALGSLSTALEAFKDNKEDVNTSNTIYEERPKYRYFED